MSSLAALRPLSSLTLERPDAYTPPTFAGVEENLAAIDRGGPETLSMETLRDDLHWFARQVRFLEAMSARWLAELDRREEQAPDDHHSSSSEWLCDTLGLTANAARAQVRTARALDGELRLTAGALRRGEISSQHVAVIRRAMEQIPKTCLEPGSAESELVFAARQMDPFSLEQHWEQMRYQADQEAGVEAEAEQRQARWLSLRQVTTGNYRIEGILDAENGATLKTALRAITGRKARDDERTPGQRRADAIGELARHRLDAGDLPERGGEKPHLLLIAELSTLRLEPGSRLAQLDWGPLVTGETARRIAEDAAVTPVLVDGKGDVLHVGRRSRTVPAAVRRALNLRDRHCQGPGCEMPPELCSPHHKRLWVDGGSHDLSNLELRCDHCHGELHPENRRFRQGRAP